jgi:hypothetical protein
VFFSLPQSIPFNVRLQLIDSDSTMSAAAANGSQLARPYQFSDALISCADHPSRFRVVDTQDLGKRAPVLSKHFPDQCFQMWSRCDNKLLDELLPK